MKEVYLPSPSGVDRPLESWSHELLASPKSILVFG